MCYVLQEAAAGDAAALEPQTEACHTPEPQMEAFHVVWDAATPGSTPGSVHGLSENLPIPKVPEHHAEKLAKLDEVGPGPPPPRVCITYYLSP